MRAARSTNPSNLLKLVVAALAHEIYSPEMPSPGADSFSSSSAPPVANPRPTRTRYWVIVFAVTLAIIQYIDRVCISQAAPFISKDLKLDEPAMGWVFSAFTLAYALFEIPAGYLGD